MECSISHLGNDLQNGILGFSEETQRSLMLDEDSEKRKVELVVSRQSNRCKQQLIESVIFIYSNALCQIKDYNCKQDRCDWILVLSLLEVPVNYSKLG